MKRIVLVNGVPASGKSTVTRQLVRALDVQGIAAVPLGLDTVKEGLFAQIGTGDREYNRKLGRASYHAIFNLIAEMPDSVIPIVDAWHGFQPESVLRDHLARAGVGHAVEIWVRIAPEAAALRYRNRASGRASGHLPASYADELYELAGRARPLSLGRVIEIDGDAPVPQDIAAQVLAALRDTG